MKHERPSPQRAIFERFCGYGAAVVIACVVLGAPLGESTALECFFGWPRLLVVHVLFVLPFCAGLATLMRQRLPNKKHLALAMVWGLVGLMAASVSIALAPRLAAAFDAENAGFAARWLARTILCVAVELPWCAAVEVFAARHDAAQTTATSPPWRVPRWGFVVAFVAATAVPAAYGLDVSRREAARATGLLERQQLVNSQQIVTALATAGSAAPVSGMPPREATKKLTAMIAAIERRLQETAEDSRDPQQKIERAAALAMLDRPDEACRCIASLALERPDAALLLAAVLQQQQRYDESSRSYQAAAQMLREAPQSPQAVAGLVRALNGVAFNARETGAYAEAEAAYQQGLAELPSEAAHFHFQLGRHHKLGGRPAAAATHLQEAARLAPQTYARQAEILLGQIALDTPGCILGHNDYMRHSAW